MKLSVLILLLLIGASSGACAESPVTGRDLSDGRVDFLRALAKSSEPVDREIVRQHLFDADHAIAAEARRLLEKANDVPTRLERHMLDWADAGGAHDGMRAEAEAFLANIKDDRELRTVAEHARSMAYRPEMPSYFLSATQARLQVKYRDLDEMDWKRGGLGGGAPGYLSHDGLGIAPSDEEARRKDDEEAKSRPRPENYKVLADKPFAGAWAMRVSWQANAPCVADGRFYLGDGSGFVCCGETETGRWLWRVPFPTANHARLTTDGIEVRVAQACGAGLELISRFRCVDGRWLGSDLRAIETAVGPVADGGSVHVRSERGDRGSVLLCEADGREKWRIDVPCPIRGLRVEGGSVIVLGEWMHGCAALGAFRVEDGKMTWCSPVAYHGERVTLAACDPENVWLLSEESWIGCWRLKDGARLLARRWINEQDSLPITRLEYDRQTDRILLDPSTGFVYSIKRSALLSALGIPAPVAASATFGAVLGLDVTVKTEEFDLTGPLVSELFETKGDAQEIPQMPDPTTSKESRLFARFAGRYEAEKFQLSATNWRPQWTFYRSALLAAAKARSFDSEELAACIDVIDPGDSSTVAWVPVAAYRITVDGEPAWAISCRWEYAEDGMCLSHINITAVAVRTRKKLVFVKCG